MIRTLFFCASAWLFSSLCAPVRGAPAIYNPIGLRADQLASIDGICQRVLGLSPGEPPTGGYWMGNSRLEHWTSHYRGCVLCLSEALQREADTRVVQQADAECRAKGLRQDSPELALCVIRSVNRHPDPGVAGSPSPPPAPAQTGRLPAATSFLKASNDEIVRREASACASLGLQPATNAFEACTKGLRDTFYAIEHPVD